MSLRTARISTMVEPEVDDMFKRLANKKGMTCSNFLRALVLDELQIHGMMPEEIALALLKGSRA